MNQMASLSLFLIFVSHALYAVECFVAEHTKNPTIRLGSSKDRDSQLDSCDVPMPRKVAFDAAVLDRYSCKKFKRFDGIDVNSTATKHIASTSDPNVVQQALHCLEVARRAPSAFNTQPYKVLLVHSPSQKEAMSKYCLGPNKRRVLDSDCTAVFLADKQLFRSLPRYITFLRESMQKQHPDRKLSRKYMLQTQFYITLFSSGYPLPRFLSAVISFFVRTAVSVVNLFTAGFYPMPSLANAETWSSKQVMMVAMIYMLGCSARGLDTIPMEGINARGIRHALQIPSRYAIPIIVSTGTAAVDGRQQQRRRVHSGTERYPIEEVIYGDYFGRAVELPPSS